MKRKREREIQIGVFFIRNTDWNPSHGINSPYMTLQKGMLQIVSANTVHLPNFKIILLKKKKNLNYFQY